MAVPPLLHHRLIWKYTTVVVLLVVAAIVSVGVTELYFSYEDSKLAVTGDVTALPGLDIVGLTDIDTKRLAADRSLDVR